MANYVLYGFNQLKDLDPQSPAAELDRDLVISAINETVDSHNREINTLLSLFCEDTTLPQAKYKGGYANFLQPVDENGDPKPVKGLVDYTVGFALKMGATASGANWVTNLKMTVEDFDRTIGQMLIGDVNWIRRHLLAALFTNTNSGWTFGDPEHGDITVQGLANGDATKYAFVNSDDLATDNHYSRQATAIASNDNPLPNIQGELEEHPDNAGPFIMFASAERVAEIEGLAEFVDVPQSQIATPPPQTTLPVLNATLGVPLPRTARVVGTYRNLWVVEWGAIPDDYTITIAANGPRPLRRRQDPQTALQGFVNIGEMIEKFPFYKNRWFRRTGFGAWNRVGAYVHQVTAGSTTYQIPTGFNYAALP